LPVLPVNSCSIDQKSGEICTGQADLQPISFKSDRLLVIATITLVIALTVAVVIAMVIIPVMIIAVPALMITHTSVTMIATTVHLPVTWGILAVVPTVLHKIDALAAGIILTAVPAPMPDLTGRYAQVDRRAIHETLLNHHRLGIDHLWRRKTTHIELTIETGLTDIDRNTDIGNSE
jgi:hypothetical protein